MSISPISRKQPFTTRSITATKPRDIIISKAGELPTPRMIDVRWQESQKNLFLKFPEAITVLPEPSTISKREARITQPGNLTPEIKRVIDALERDQKLRGLFEKAFGDNIKVFDQRMIDELSPELKTVFEKSNFINGVDENGKPYVWVNTVNLNRLSLTETEFQGAIVRGMCNEIADVEMRDIAGTKASADAQWSSAGAVQLITDVYSGVSLSEAFERYNTMLKAYAKPYAELGFPPSRLDNPSAVAEAHNQLCEKLGIPLRFIGNETGIYPTGTDQMGNKIDNTKSDTIYPWNHGGEPILAGPGKDAIIGIFGNGTFHGGKNDDIFMGSVEKDATVDIYGGKGYDVGTFVVGSRGTVNAFGMEGSLTFIPIKGLYPATVNIYPASGAYPPVKIEGNSDNQQITIVYKDGLF